jgi:hypothetical protein
MIKLSSEQVQAVAGQAAQALRHLSAENTQLKEKVAFYQRQDRAERIASVMETKNLDSDLTYQEKVAKLMTGGDLDVVEQAVGLAAQQVKLAALSDVPGNATDAASAFEQGILGG